MADYYTTLEIPSTATEQQIRDAYKRAALRTHPDRVPADSPDRPKRTRLFQSINDAYYTLSDPARRRAYDSARRSSHVPPPGSFPSEAAGADPAGRGGGGGVGGGGGWAGSFPWGMFGMGGGAGGADEAEARTRAENEQFGGVFEEMLREEGLASEDNHATGRFWALVGGASGAAMGFIVANVAGAVAGAVAGNRLGAVRDARGKSVYSVFQELPQADKARLLSQLAAKVFNYAVSS